MHLQICVLLLRRVYTWYMVHDVCVRVCVNLSEGYLLAKAFGSWTSFGSTIQCVVTMIAFMAEVGGMSVGSGFPVLSSRGWLVK